MSGVTIKDVAKAAGISISAASAVLNGNGQLNIRVSPATRERILTAAASLGYSANPIAQSLVTRKTGVLGLAFPYSNAFTDGNPFFTNVMSGALEEVIRAKYNVMLHTAVGESWTESGETALLDPRIEGLLLVLPDPGSIVVQRCQERRFPCVTLVYKPDTPDICAVNADDFTGGLLATHHLLELGHTRIAHFQGNPEVATTLPRQQGYQAALRQAGFAPDPDLLLPAGFDWTNGYRMMAHLLEWPIAKRPTAIFAANDLCAEGALRLLKERRLSVPEDISLVGYDDTWVATMTQPPLTSVRMPINDMATLAARMLIQLVEGREVAERQPVFPVSLTVRSSSGTPSR